MNTNPDNQFLNTMSNDPGNWKGPIYYIREDPRLIVPKLQPSLGWTLNFAHHGSYLALAALIAVVILCAIIGK